MPNTAGPPILTHVDAEGGVRMVDVSAKQVTRRVAEASCLVLLAEATRRRLAALPKGDARVTAQLAGVQAAKRTWELIPLAHPLSLEQVDVQVEDTERGVVVRSRVVVTARTGAEMEALTACSVAALTIYDMVKSIDRGAEITSLRLEAKSGGKSGDYRRSAPEADSTAAPREPAG
ncbi:MAG: cyclic pyranopterin monophosphate synthase MoaC [Acidobacteria bacterium]|nr:MAG: cyclic pyranopterin monophosphate synthase MoaC [Acidobacteriota bacterium]REK10686.1 MAG: cyclic pyranopterin monophosphate synthase MoaC [Acidobacteriota bacterium]